MGKTRDFLKKIRDAKGTFHAKMGTIKDRNCMDLTEAKDIKKKWQEYTESEQSESHSVVSGSLRPHGLYSPWNSPGQNTGVGSVFLLQGIFPTEGSNPSPTLHVDSFPEELGKKDLQDPCNHDGVITHLEPDILECEVKWALGSITTKLVEVMEFQLNYFKS